MPACKADLAECTFCFIQRGDPGTAGGGGGGTRERSDPEARRAVGAAYRGHEPVPPAAAATAGPAVQVLHAFPCCMHEDCSTPAAVCGTHLLRSLHVRSDSPQTGDLACESKNAESACMQGAGGMLADRRQCGCPLQSGPSHASSRCGCIQRTWAGAALSCSGARGQQQQACTGHAGRQWPSGQCDNASPAASGTGRRAPCTAACLDAACAAVSRRAVGRRQQRGMRSPGCACSGTSSSSSGNTARAGAPSVRAAKSGCARAVRPSG